MIVFAFDVDGTCETGNPPGPIPLNNLLVLKNRGHVVGIISGSLARVKNVLGDQLDFYLAGSKAGEMVRVAQHYVGEAKIYVGDSPTDMVAAKIAKWGFVYAKDFRVENYL